ncbi:MAG: hypothetical protein U9Q03_04590 [Patescibacteria group bacterium]|nr:hypothetical protein [Patescibacteria group bacterium]
MAIDWDEIRGQFPDLRYTVIEQFHRSGHEVAIVLVENTSVEHDCSSVTLECECDYEMEEREHEGRKYQVHCRDSGKCRAKRDVRRHIVRRSRKRYGDRWESLGIKEAVMDVQGRVKAREFMGQSSGSCIYAQEVARLLDYELDEILEACAELFVEERLQLNGMILWDYEVRLRFPRQVQMVLVHLSDEYGTHYESIEVAVGEQTEYTRGHDAFGEVNYPEMDKNILVEHALKPVIAKLTGIAAGSDVSGDLRAVIESDIPADLDGFAAAHPEIDRAVFAEVIRWMYRLVLEQIEILEKMATCQDPPKKIVNMAIRSLELLIETPASW